MYAVRSLPFALELNEIPHSVWNEAGEFRHDAVWAATSAGDADAAVRWDFCRLDFLFLFDQAKRKEENDRAGGISMSLDFLFLFDQAKRKEENNNMNGRFQVRSATKSLVKFLPLL
jgi:hypothetical protein